MAVPEAFVEAPADIREAQVVIEGIRGTTMVVITSPLWAVCIIVPQWAA